MSKTDKKWGLRLSSHGGFLALPNLILKCQRELALDSLDMNILIQLLSHSHGENLAYPSKERICARIGIDESTLRRRIARLEKRGLIKRQERYNTSRNKGRDTNIYLFDGLYAAVQELAEVEIWNKEPARKTKVKGETHGQLLALGNPA